MPPRSARLGLAALTLVLPVAALSAVSAAPAHAQAQVIRDPDGDRFPRNSDLGDIARTKVEHGRYALKVTVAHHPTGDRTVEDVTLVWVDTDPTDPGPEYRIGAYLETEGVGISRVDDWRRLGGTAVPCDDAKMIFRLDPSVPLRLRIPRGCLGFPARLRASVATEPDYPFRRVDWAPGRRTFGAWLRSGPVR